MERLLSDPLTYGLGALLVLALLLFLLAIWQLRVGRVVQPGSEVGSFFSSR